MLLQHLLLLSGSTSATRCPVECRLDGFPNTSFMHFVIASIRNRTHLCSSRIICINIHKFTPLLSKSYLVYRNYILKIYLVNRILLKKDTAILVFIMYIISEKILLKILSVSLILLLYPYAIIIFT